MVALVVTAHPDPDSLTHRAAARLAERLGDPGARTAHLAQEGFDPRFTTDDRRASLGTGRPPADVLAEQARLDAVDHLALVFPVYWWSMPALLKGWIDRVFVTGWAFDLDDEAGRIAPRLGRLTAHMLPLAGTSAASFARHGYTASFETQIERGIFDYCGVRRGTTAFLYDAESADEALVGRAVEDATNRIARGILGTVPPAAEPSSATR